MEAHGATLDALYDRIKVAVMLETDRSHALRAAIFACAKGGTVSIPGVYGGFGDKIPLGADLQPVPEPAVRDLSITAAKQA